MCFPFQLFNRFTNKAGLAVLVFASFITFESLGANASGEKSAAQLLAMPMSFEVNNGQTADSVRYLSRGPGYTLFLTPTEAVLSLRSSRMEVRGRNQPSPPRKINQARLTMTFAGANPKPEIEGIDALSSVANYFVGNKPSQWRTSISTYGKVKYNDLYSGVDLVFYGSQKQVEYDFLVKLHADPKVIAISFSGIDSLEIDKEGGLVAHLAGGDVRWEKPFAYQETETGRKEVPAKFVLR